MLNHREDSGNYFGSTVLIVLFFFFICALTDNSDRHTGRANHNISVSDLRSQVIALNDARQIPWQKIVIPVNEKTNFNLLSGCRKIVADNRSIHHRILLLQKALLKIKPILLHRFYFQYHSIDTDDLPVLS
jgi:hypothetical protein